MTLTSPSTLKSPAKSNITESTIITNVEEREPISINMSMAANKHSSQVVTIDQIPSPTQTHKDISAKSIGTMTP